MRATAARSGFATHPLYPASTQRIKGAPVAAAGAPLFLEDYGIRMVRAGLTRITLRQSPQPIT